MKSPPRLVALSPGTLEQGGREHFLAALAAALAAGLPGLLLREPGLDDRTLLALGEAVAAQRSAHPFWFALHDRAHLARSLGADAVHLSFRSLPVREARRVVGDELALGLSTHADDDPATWRGADYLVHGPLHETPSKAGRLAPIGFDGLARACARTDVPLLALGGVRPADVRPARAAGAHGVAVRAGLLLASDPAAATGAYLAGVI